jgi:hypothetical protein
VAQSNGCAWFAMPGCSTTTFDELAARASKLVAANSVGITVEKLSFLVTSIPLSGWDFSLGALLSILSNWFPDIGDFVKFPLFISSNKTFVLTCIDEFAMALTIFIGHS